MRRLQGSLAFVVGLIGSCSASAAADLNAPLNERPTIGSEIRRGEHAAFECSLDAMGDFMKCVLDVSNAEQQKLADADAFLLGLYYAACIDESLRLQADTEIGDTNSFAAAAAPEDRSNLASFYRWFREKQQKYRVTDEQLVTSEVDRTEDFRKQTLQKLKAWESSPPTAQ